MDFRITNMEFGIICTEFRIIYMKFRITYMEFRISYMSETELVNLLIVKVLWCADLQIFIMT